MPQMPGIVGDVSPDRRDRAVARRRADDLDQRAGLRCPSRPRRSARRSRPSRSRCLRAARAPAPIRGTGGRPACPAAARGRRGDRAARRASDRAARETSLDGRPPHASEYIALWPAAQTQRTMSFGSSTPASTAGTKSASSTQLAAASNTSGATFRHFQIFDHHHSDEYVPPIGARYCGACCARHRGDRRRFVRAGVVLPQPRVRGEVAFPSRIERQRPRLRIDRQRRRAGRVDADADHAIAREPGRRAPPRASAPVTDCPSAPM